MDWVPAPVLSLLGRGHGGCSHNSLRGSSLRVSFLSLPIDASALVAALTQFSHLAADTIIHGSATAHLAPTDPADRKWAQPVSHRFSWWTREEWEPADGSWHQPGWEPVWRLLPGS